MTHYNEDGYPIRDTNYKLDKVSEAIAKGAAIVDAINRNCNTLESYSAALKKYDIPPTSNDYD